MKYTVGSLFAGVGGICLGFKNAKTKNSSYELSWANELDEYACVTYRTNFKHTLLEGDIEKILHPTRIDESIADFRKQILNANAIREKKLEKELTDLLKKRDSEFEQYLNEGVLPEWIEQQNKIEEFENYIKLREAILSKPIDVLNGGFPCQAFSIAGEQNGFKDPRGNLFLSIVDLIELLGKTHSKYDVNGKIVVDGKPRILFLENVKNLKSHANGKTYETIKKSLETCGYTIFERVLNTMNYSNLPQNRERIYIIGFRDEVDAKKFHLFDENIINGYLIDKTIEQRKKDVENLIDYSLTISTAEKYYYTKEKYPSYFGAGEFDLAVDVDSMYEFYQVRRGQYVRKNQSNVCPTLTANMGTGGHNVPLVKVSDGIRKITPKEAFKLQGFPVDNGYKLPNEYKGKPYTDSHLYKQAGNAVSVPIIKLIAEYLLRIMEGN